MLNQNVTADIIKKTIDSEGFAVIPFLKTEEVDVLRKFYDEESPKGMSGFHASMFYDDEAYRHSVDTIIRRHVENKVRAYLPGFSFLYSNFMVKESGESSDMYIHQDWSYVDEQNFDSYAIWIPLTDLSHENGGLYVVRNSHRVKNFIRGPGIEDPFIDIHDEIRDNYSELVPLKAGEAIIWHHRLVHFSPPNMTDQSRVAITAILTPENAGVYHFIRENGESDVEKFEVDKGFFMSYKIGARPTNAISKGFIDFEFPRLTLEAWEIINGSRPKPKKSTLEKLFSHLGMARTQKK